MSIGLKRNSFHEVIRNLVAFFLSLSSDLWESVKNEMGYRIKLPTSRPPRQGTLSIMTPLPSSSLGACQTQGIYGCHVRWVACRSSVSRWDLETIIEQKIKGKKTYLVGGSTILKNISQWEGWHPIYEMENKKMFETTNQISYSRFWWSNHHFALDSSAIHKQHN